MTKTSFFLLSSFFLTACIFNGNKENCRKKLQDALSIQVSNNIRITDYNDGYSSTSDFNESFNVHFSKEEFYRIIGKAKLKKCNEDTTIFCYEKKRNKSNGATEITSITFYPDSLLANYYYIGE